MSRHTRPTERILQLLLAVDIGPDPGGIAMLLYRDMYMCSKLTICMHELLYVYMTTVRTVGEGKIAVQTTENILTNCPASCARYPGVL